MFGAIGTVSIDGAQSLLVAYVRVVWRSGIIAAGLYSIGTD
jgi:hypothetical protein